MFRPMTSSWALDRSTVSISLLDSLMEEVELVLLSLLFSREFNECVSEDGP